MAITNSKIETGIAGYLEQVAGPNEGQVYELGFDAMGLGRSEDNAIIVQSGGVSRYHAILEHDGEVHRIRDNGSKNGVQVNSQLVDDVALNHGDVIQIGDSVFRYYAPGDDSQLPAIDAQSYSVERAAGFPMAPHETSDLSADAPGAFGGMMSAVGNVGAVSKAKVPGRNRRPIIYGAVGLVLLLLYFQSEETPSTGDTDGKKSGKVILENASELGGTVEIDIGGPEPELAGLRDPSLNDAERAVKNYDFNDSSVLEAEQFFRRGRRDYLNKEYHRAIQSLATALDLDQSHRLAELYLKRSLIEAEEEAKKHLNLALKYFESLQYQRSIYHFEQVESYMQHRKEHEIVKQSKKYIEVAEKRLQGAELFP